MGEFGRAFASLNLHWFGYFGYFYLLLFIYPAFMLYKDYTLTKARLKHIFAILLLAFGALLLQFVFFKQGELGKIIIENLTPKFGNFGVWILIILCVFVGLFLFFPRQMSFIKDTISSLILKLFAYLKCNFIEAYFYLKPSVTKAYEILKTKAKKVLYYLSNTEYNKILDSRADLAQSNDLPQNLNLQNLQNQIPQSQFLRDSLQIPNQNLQSPSQEQFAPFNENSIRITYTNKDLEHQKQLQSEQKYAKMVRVASKDEEGEVLDLNINEVIARVKKHQIDPFTQGQNQAQNFQYIKPATDSKEAQSVQSQTLESKDLNTLGSKESHFFKSAQESITSNYTDSLKPNPDSRILESSNPKVQILKELESTNAILENLDKGTLEKPKDYILPPTSLLAPPPAQKVHFEEDEIDTKIQNLLGKLKVFKIDGDVSRIYSGPVVTTFEFRPAPNIKVSRILGLSDDLAMALCAQSIRIQAPIPGKDVVGIEVPNSESQTIYMREILESEVFTNSASPLALGLGKDIVGNPFVTDLKKLPHLLIAGTTGSGKSVGVNAMILSLLYRNAPENLKLIMIDPKKVEFSLYEEIPHLLTPIITDSKKAIIALGNVAKEMERRYEIMKEAKSKTIDNYNAKAKEEGKEILPFIVVIIDELADLMMTGGKEAEASIIRIAQMGRAAGLHLIVATQRPSVDVVTGLIKTNLPAKIAFKVGSRMDSRVILDSEGAQNLLGRGDMLFSLGGGSNIIRLHAPWSSEEEIEEIVKFIREQRSASYDSSFLAESAIRELESSFEGSDDLLSEAKKIMLMDGKTSISNLQRRLGIGYNKAASIVEELEKQGFLSAPNSKGVREIIG